MNVLFVWALLFFSVRDHPGFDHPEATLQRLVDTEGTVRENHFCAVGYRAYDVAWVYWPEGNALVLWEPVDGDRPLAWSRRFLRLDRDVVATEEDVGGSTYRVTRAWVNRTIADCRAHGESFVLERTVGARRPSTPWRP